MRVAFLQFSPVWEKKERNFEMISRLFACHLMAGEVDLLLLPEMFSTGFTMNAKDLAEPLGDPEAQTLRQCMEWAKEYQTHIAATWITTDQKGAFYNTLHVVSPDSKLLGYYHKRYRFRMAGEEKVYSPGEKPLVLQVNHVPVYFQICYDLRFPCHSMNRKVRDDGTCWYDVGINLASWPAKRAHHWIHLLQGRAIENQAYFLGVNRMGVDGNGIEYDGNSVAVNFHGELIAHAKRTEGICKVELDISALKQYRKDFPVWQDWETLET
jgi:predicted amidohydrolase